MSGWPEVNSLAFVDVVDEAVMLQSRVESVEGTAVTLAAPTGAYGMPVLPTAGETVLIAWNTMRGYFERKGIVESSERTPQPRMTVRPLGDVRKLQRRAHVRVPQLAPVDLTFEGKRLRASLLDVSESGVRCVIDRPSPLGMDSEVEVRLQLLDESEVSLVAVPARMYAIDDEHLEVGLTFVDIDDRTASRIRRHVFSQQVRDRAMGIL
jgi:c-di-GMP-binding flagellar brake protein YcgR